MAAPISADLVILRRKQVEEATGLTCSTIASVPLQYPTVPNNAGAPNSPIDAFDFWK